MFPTATITERVDRLEGWARQGCKTAQWMSWACGVGPEAGRERVRVARALPDLPVTSRAFSTGELSYSKVRAITRIATPPDRDAARRVGPVRHGRPAREDRPGYSPDAADRGGRRGTGPLREALGPVVLRRGRDARHPRPPPRRGREGRRGPRAGALHELPAARARRPRRRRSAHRGGDGDTCRIDGGPEIAAETTVPDDYQRRPDYGLAVGLLLERLGGAPLP